MTENTLQSALLDGETPILVREIHEEQGTVGVTTLTPEGKVDIPYLEVNRGRVTGLQADDNAHSLRLQANTADAQAAGANTVEAWEKAVALHEKAAVAYTKGATNLERAGLPGPAAISLSNAERQRAAADWGRGQIRVLKHRP